jgi:hypothetical protein
MLAYQELGTFAFSFRMRGVHGMGLSASSGFLVCYAGAQYYVKHGALLCSELIAAEALRIGRPGCCCSAAIEPRSEILLSSR